MAKSDTKSNVHIIHSNNENDKSKDDDLLKYLDSMKTAITEHPDTVTNIISIVLTDDGFSTVMATDENSDLELVGLLDIVKQKMIDDMG